MKELCARHVFFVKCSFVGVLSRGTVHANNVCGGVVVSGWVACRSITQLQLLMGKSGQIIMSCFFKDGISLDKAVFDLPTRVYQSYPYIKRKPVIENGTAYIIIFSNGLVYR